MGMVISSTSISRSGGSIFPTWVSRPRGPPKEPRAIVRSCLMPPACPATVETLSAISPMDVSTSPTSLEKTPHPLGCAHPEIPVLPPPPKRRVQISSLCVSILSICLDSKSWVLWSQIAILWFGSASFIFSSDPSAYLIQVVPSPLMYVVPTPLGVPES